MKKSHRYIIMFLLVGLQGINLALALKASIGVAAWDAVNQSLGFLFNIKVGTMLIILNTFMILGQWILLRKDFKIVHVLQMLVSFVLGMAINFFYYNVFTFEINSYIIRMILLVFATVASALTLAVILNMVLISFPPEGLSQALNDKKGISFVKARMGIDIISIIVSLLTTLVFKMPLVIREGTLITTVIFSPLLGAAMNKFKEPMRKLKLIV